jgi:NAD(P)-dependent dehydrogenase (short-subunit alcohol dehydrogenase family)
MRSYQWVSIAFWYLPAAAMSAWLPSTSNRASSIAMSSAPPLHHYSRHKTGSSHERSVEVHGTSKSQPDEIDHQTSSSSRRNFIGTSAAATVASSLAFASPLVSNAAFTSSSSTQATSSNNNNNSNKIYNPPAGSLTHKTVLITGGNTGLGLESAKRLAAAGATVIVTTRTASKGQAAVQAIREYVLQAQAQSSVTSNGGEKELLSEGSTTSAITSPAADAKVSYVTLDLTDLEQVRRFRQTVINSNNKNIKIDVLLNNAGVMAIPDRQLTKDGFERTFQTNYLAGNFALTAQLLPLLASNARIINVASEGWRFAGRLDLQNLNGERAYGPWSSYGQSKLANIVYTRELQRRLLQASHSNNKYNNNTITVVSLHPGAVATDLGRYFVGGEDQWNRMKTKDGLSWSEQLVFGTLAKFTKTVEEGASTQVFLAADPSVSDHKGSYYMDCQVVASGGQPPVDFDQAKALWAASEQMTGITYEL